MAADLLETIVAATRRIVEVRQVQESFAALTELAAAMPLRAGEIQAALAQTDGINVIAECKRRSPSRGVLRADYDPAAIATARQGTRFAAREANFAARRAAVRQNQTDARTRIGELGGTVLESMDTVVNALIVSIPDARAAELSKVPGVVKVHPVDRVRPLLDHALARLLDLPS